MGSLEQVDIHLHFVYPVQVLLIFTSVCPKISYGLLKKQSSSASLHIVKPFDVLDSALIAVFDVLSDAIGDFVNMRARDPLAIGHECRAVTEQLVHVFEVETFRLWLETPKEYGTGEIADYEDKIESLLSVLVYSWVDELY